MHSPSVRTTMPLRSMPPSVSITSGSALAACPNRAVRARSPGTLVLPSTPNDRQRDAPREPGTTLLRTRSDAERAAQRLGAGTDVAEAPATGSLCAPSGHAVVSDGRDQ